MKKSLIIALCLILLCAFAFSSCGGSSDTDTDNEHKHTYDYSKWATDETHHWYGATCEHTNIKISLSEHVDEDDNGVCDTCAYDYNHQHTFNGEWTVGGTDEATHSHCHERTCSHTGISNKDEGTFVDENKDGVCDTCEWSDTNHTHNHESKWTTEGATEANHKHYHKLACSHTSIGNKDEGAFVDENKDGVCDTCKWLDLSHTHTFDEKWTTEGTTEADHKHYHLPTCSHTGIDATEIGSFIDANKDGVCDKCEWYDESHTHTYDEAKWEQNTTHHGYLPSCSHTGIEWKDYTEHTDSDEDKICDVCEYDLGHVHQFDLESWVSDYKGHYHPAICDHKTVRGEEAGEEPHSDENLDGICDVCQWFDETHTHTYDTENWLTEGTNAQDHKHYHGASCEHIGIDHIDVEALFDENNDGICDVCEASVCSHDFSEEYVYDLYKHWHKPGCTHNVVGDEGEHVGTEDGVCDVCNGEIIDFAELINSATSDETANKVLSGTIEKVLNGTAATVVTRIEYKFGTNFIYIKETETVDAHEPDDNGNLYHGEYVTEYWYTSVNDGQGVLGMMSYDGGEVTKVNTEIVIDCLKGAYFAGSFMDSAYNAYGVEQLVLKFFDLEASAGENVELITRPVEYNYYSETNEYVMNVIYNGYTVEMRFTLGENNVIEELKITNNSNLNSSIYTITQVQGERTESSPYDTESGMIKEIVITDLDGNVLDLDKPIAIDANVMNKYKVIITPEDFDVLKDGIEMGDVYIDGVIAFFDMTDGTLGIKGVKKGIQTVVLKTMMLSVTLNFDVSLPAPTKIETEVYYSDGGYEKSDEAQTFIGFPLGISGVVEYGAEMSYTAEITQGGDIATLEWDEEEEYYVLNTTATGTVKIKVASAKDPNVSTVLTVTVKEQPKFNVAEILSGRYEYSFYKELMYEITFFPSSEGATEGKLWYNDLANKRKLTGLYSYKYVYGTVEVYNDDGTVTPNIIINISDLGTFTVSTDTTTTPTKKDIEAKDVLIGKYNILGQDGQVMYNVIFTPNDIYGANAGSVSIKAVNGTDNSVVTVCKFEYANGALTFKDSVSSEAINTIPLTIDASFNLLWNGYTVERVNLSAEDVLSGEYEVVKMSGKKIRERDLYSIAFDYESKKLTIVDNNETGWSGTYSFTYENGTVTVGDGAEFALVLTPGHFLISLTKDDGSVIFTTIRK